MRPLGFLRGLALVTTVFAAGNLIATGAETQPLPKTTPTPTSNAASVSGSNETGAGRLTRTEAEATLQKALQVRQVSSNLFAIGDVTFDRQQRTVSIPARINLRDTVIEYALVHTAGKTHESLLATDVNPEQVHLACLLLGLSPAAVTGARDTAQIIPATNEVSITVSWSPQLPTNQPAQRTPAQNRPDSPPARVPQDGAVADASRLGQPVRFSLAELVTLKKVGSEK